LSKHDEHSIKGEESKRAIESSQQMLELYITSVIFFFFEFNSEKMARRGAWWWWCVPAIKFPNSNFPAKI